MKKFLWPNLIFLLLATACPGGGPQIPDAGDSLAPNPEPEPEPEGACASEVAINPGCGGEPEGAWSFIEACIGENSTVREVAEALSGCDGSTSVITEVSAAGFISFTAGEYVIDTLGTASMQVFVPDACLPTFGGCEFLGNSLGGSCLEIPAGGCDCSLQSGFQDEDNGTYSLNNGIATTVSKSDGNTRDFLYCVEEDRAGFQEFFDEGLGPVLIGELVEEEEEE